MQELQKQAAELQTAIDNAIERLDLARLETELAGLTHESQAPDFWADNQRAQSIMKEQSKLQARIEQWQSIKRQADDLKELADLGDTSLQPDLERQYQVISQLFGKLKRELQFSGAYDDHDTLLSIYAGAGGTDAQDWAQMLLRMYVRYAEQAGFKLTTIDESSGDEAGIKSATIELGGAFAYGKLRGEHGVHRLVRLSPFNADNLRQTSFAKVEVMPKLDKPDDLEIDEKDLKVDVYRSGGKGGQSVNTTDSAVRVTHVPTGITVAIQNERSQLQNKETAMTILRSKLAQLQLEQHLEKLSDLKGPNQSAEWGNQIRSYVLHPYKMVKDLRTGHETSDTEGVLDGGLEGFITAYLEHTLG